MGAKYYLGVRSVFIDVIGHWYSTISHHPLCEHNYTHIFKNRGEDF